VVGEETNRLPAMRFLTREGAAGQMAKMRLAAPSSSGRRPVRRAHPYAPHPRQPNRLQPRLLAAAALRVFLLGLLLGHGALPQTRRSASRTPPDLAVPRPRNCVRMGAPAASGTIPDLERRNPSKPRRAAPRAGFVRNGPARDRGAKRSARRNLRDRQRPRRDRWATLRQTGRRLFGTERAEVVGAGFLEVRTPDAQADVVPRQ
jgi:hypothetical protein